MMQDRAQRTPEPKAAHPPQAAGTRVLQRKCGCGNSSGGDGDCGSCADEKKKKVQRRAIGATTPEIPASVDRVLQSPGRALDHVTRASMESRFGHDFSRVRVHIDTHAASSAHDIQAAAYTSGMHIVFGDRRFEPHTARGRRLLAHELAHVVQQGGGTTIPAGIGAHDDIHERAADHVANAVVAQGAAFAPKPMARANERLIRREEEENHDKAPPGALTKPTLQGSFISGLRDTLLFIPRLFGLEYFPAVELRRYLDGLRQRRGPQRSLFSDNMARACVSRENELGPYNTETKTWLVQDMLDGHVSSLDEEAIIALLRRSSDWARVVDGVGRPLMWSKFTGRNRRILEALTLTATDATDALVDRLRILALGEIRDYSANATDPAVLEAVRRAAALRHITAPVPTSAAISSSGIATFQINGIDVIAEPDVYSKDWKLGAGNKTDFRLDVVSQGSAIRNVNSNTVAQFTPPRYVAVVQTTYGPESDPAGKSGYGRGTTLADRAAGHTSVRFHESRHGEDWFDYLRGNPLPQFTGRVGMTPSEYDQARTDLEADMKGYVDRALVYSDRVTDCVGTLPTLELFSQAHVADKQLTDVVTICHQQGAVR